MISWGPNNNATDEIKSQTEGKFCFEITIAIRTLEKIDEATPPPSFTQNNPGTESPREKNPKFQTKEQNDQNSRAIRKTDRPIDSEKRQNTDP